MKISKLGGFLLGGVALTLVGCEPRQEQPAEAERKSESPATPPVISTPEPPVEPSPVPAMPSPNGTETEEKKAEPEPDKNAVPKAEEKKAEEPGKAEAPQ